MFALFKPILAQESRKISDEFIWILCYNIVESSGLYVDRFSTMQSENYWKKKQGHELFERALQLEAEGKTVEAIDAYRESLIQWPHNGQAQYNLGIALATAGRIDQAIRAWKKAVWLDQSFRYELIKAFDISDDLREAIIEDEYEEELARAA